MRSYEIYGGEHSFQSRDAPKVDDDVFVKIRAHYDEGGILFSKAAIREVQKQLDSTEAGSRIWIPALDGSWVDFEIETGKALFGKGPTIGKPFIRFRTIQTLLSRQYNKIPRTAYCSMHLYHFVDADSRRLDQANEVDVTSSSELTHHETKDLLTSTFSAWKRTDQHRILRSLLLEVNVQQPIRRVIGFALASIACVDPPEGNRTAAYQHACLMTLSDVMQERGCTTADFACISQEPGYTVADKEALSMSQVYTVESPEGFLEVEDDTVVLSISPNVPVKQIIFDSAKPAVLVCNTECQPDLLPSPAAFPHPSEPALSPFLYTDSDSPRILQILETFYDRFDFPGGSEHFPPLNIFVRRAAPRIESEQGPSPSLTMTTADGLGP